MLRKIVFSLVLISIFLSMVAGAEARPQAFGSGPKSVSGASVGSGR